MAKSLGKALYPVSHAIEQVFRRCGPSPRRCVYRSREVPGQSLFVATGAGFAPRQGGTGASSDVVGVGHEGRSGLRVIGGLCSQYASKTP